MIFNHDMPEYMKKWRQVGKNRYNGAYYYSKEICENIIPNINTDRNWVTVNVEGACADHSIVFIHNNKCPEHYDWLLGYTDLILVCGVPETCDKVAHLGKPIYLPLSIDVAYVRSFATEKTKGAAYVGRRSKRQDVIFDEDVDCLEGIPRERLLAEMAKYRQVYAVGRCAIEARALDCEILPYDERYPDPSVWEVVDTSEAVEMLQQEIDKIDKKPTRSRGRRKRKIEPVETQAVIAPKPFDMAGVMIMDADYLALRHDGKIYRIDPKKIIDMFCVVE